MKFHIKILVYGVMSYRALSELHIIPPKQTISEAYYRDKISDKMCNNTTNITAITGSILERSMLANMSEFLFMQDTAALTCELGTGMAYKTLSPDLEES